MKILRNVCLFLCAATIAGALAQSPRAQDRKVTVVSYGGSYQDAQREAFFKTYAAKTGTKVLEDTWNGEIARVKAQVAAKNVTWDVVFADYHDAINACEAGAIMPIPQDIIGDVGAWIEGTVHKCAIPHELVSTIFAYDNDRIPPAWGSARPQTVVQVFDVNKFPGKRGFRKIVRASMETGLAADGVPREDVYKVLNSKGGIERSIAKFDSIKPHIVFYEKNAQGPPLLGDGEVQILHTLNGRVYGANKEGKRFHIIWDRQLIGVGVVIVPKGPNADEALRFVRHVAMPEYQAKMANLYAYGAARKAALPLIDKKILPFYPTTPENFGNALVRNEEWWADHIQEVTEKWNAWLAR